MKVSLNDLVSILAARVGQPWNSALQEEMKVVLNYKRADFFKKLITQHPEQKKLFYKTIIAELTSVDKGECDVEVGCEVKRTQLAIPLPVRHDNAPYDFVGSVDKTEGYGYATPQEYALFAKYNKYTAAKPKYYVQNGYIYLLGDEESEYITIRDIFPDPRALHEFTCNGEACYTDDDQYEIPDDLINAMIADTLRVELRNQFPQQGEVQTDKSDKKTEQGGPTEDE
jgi:hypothetical protein